MSIHEIIPYREESEELFSKMPIMTSSQFVQSMMIITGRPYLDVVDIIKMLTWKGVVLMSDNGYATTKGALDIVTDIKPTIRRTTSTRLSDIHPTEFFKKCIDCFPIILDMYPDSRNFVVHNDLFNITFFNERKGTEFEIIRIPVNQEDMYATFILNQAHKYKNERFGALRNCIRRIAVVESEACARKVPYAGFNFVIVPDGSTSKGFRIVEKRTENVWKDILDW